MDNLTDKEKFECIKRAVDQYLNSGLGNQAKIVLHSCHFGKSYIKPYKRCCFTYDNSIEKDGFIVGPVDYEI